MKNKCGRIRLLLFTILLLIVSIICFYESYNYRSNDYTEEETKTQQKEEVQVYTMPIDVKTIKHVQQVQLDEIAVEEQNDDEEYEWRYGDDYLLAKIAMAEAEGESLEGKALVMLVVINRVYDASFPDTIGEVIFQHKGDSYQFSPVKEGGRFYTNEPNDECYEALELVKSGWDESQGALYFESSKSNDTWHSRNLELLFEYGGHRFYK